MCRVRLLLHYDDTTHPVVIDEGEFCPSDLIDAIATGWWYSEQNAAAYNLNKADMVELVK